tara:strand:- start:392 stop:841 length:450 start_codon:yes stop_codon:yes gene_type:complete
MAKKKTTNSRAASARKSKVKTAKKIQTPKKEKPQLESLQQTNGKSYDEKVARAKELEQIMGLQKMSPFKTNDPEAFEEMLEDMNLTDLQAMAVKVGIFPSGNKTVLKNKIKRSFKASLTGQGSVTLMGKPLELDPNNPTHKEVLDYLRD